MESGSVSVGEYLRSSGENATNKCSTIKKASAVFPQIDKFLSVLTIDFPIPGTAEGGDETNFSTIADSLVIANPRI
ncbi:hypothetical protein D3C85_1886750 [compost metagenome]